MMTKRVWVFIFICLAVLEAFAQKDKIPVFVSGTEGHKSYRIPAIIGLQDGTLLAFCEGRVNGSADYGDVNIVLKTSKDHGKTWSTLKTVVDYDHLQAGNPAPVVDLTDPAYPKGRIFLFYNTGNNHEGEIRKGNGVREVWYKTSVDEGATWSEPVNITTQVHRPKQPQFNATYNFAEDWRSYANTPGHGLQLTNGKYKSRIFIGANHSAGQPQSHFTDYTSHGFYTDDHGKTFHLGANVNVPGSNECMAAELSNGKLMMNIRNQRGDIKQRIASISSSGGITWDSTYFDANLPDPVCQGSIITVDERKGNNVIAFCNAADTINRNHLTLRISYDDAKTWSRSFLIDANEGDKKSDFTAYSDLVNINASTVGILYERANYAQIVFTTLQWK